MGDRPILFSAPMVRALLAGTKTQTRRIIKPQPPANARYAGIHYASDEPDIWFFNSPLVGPTKARVRYEEGDRLWVRETYFGGTPGVANTCYRASSVDGRGITWKPSIFMPRWASRLTLTVTDVRVQRFFDISEEDAAAEGFEPGFLDDGFGPRDIGGGYTIESHGTYASAAGMFQIYWQEIHPEWDGFSDPWIVALTFDVRKGNIDA